MRTLLVGCSVLALTACGSNGAGFARQANAVCARQQAAARALPPNDFARLERLAQAEIDDLRALDPPDTARARFASLLAELTRQLDDVHYLRVGAASGDGQMVQAASNLARRAHARARRHAEALRLHSCAH